ncbi:MAG: hypothetical protein ACI857_002241 [Arenicella sp.]|jgi:hypothetical protein
MNAIKNKIMICAACVVLVICIVGCNSYANDPPHSEINSIESSVDLIKEQVTSLVPPHTTPLDTTDVYDVSLRDNFFIREGNYLILDEIFGKGDLINSEKHCQKGYELEDACVTIHHYAANPKSMTDKVKLLLNQTIYVGDLSTDILESTTLEFRTLNEELKDSLIGIWIAKEYCEESYYWSGGEERFSKDHSVVLIEGNHGSEDDFGWAIMSDKKPKIYESDKLEGEATQELFLEVNDLEYYRYSSRAMTFDFEETHLVVTYNIQDECGHEYFQDVMFWKKDGAGYILIQELNQVPLVIFDLDWDGEYDILYDEPEYFETHDFIGIDYPNCYISDTDTVWTCGC